MGGTEAEIEGELKTKEGHRSTFIEAKKEA